MKNLNYIKLFLSFLILLISDNQKLFGQISKSHNCGTKPAEVKQMDVQIRRLVQVPDTIIIPVVFHILTQGGAEMFQRSRCWMHSEY